MNLLTKFEFKGRAVRTVEIDGRPFFVGRDVAQCLGYKRTRDAIRDHCKGAVNHRLPSDGGAQDFAVIPEPDVYRLILRSKAPNAEVFQDWVVEEVLPAIRKTGSFGGRMPNSTELAMMVIARDKQIAIGADMMRVIEPDYSTYGATASNGKAKTGVRRAAFVAATSRAQAAAALLTLSGQMELTMLEGAK